MMTPQEMLHIVQSQLAVDLHCSIDDLNGDKDHIIYVDAQENPGRRPFRRNARYFEILSMGQTIIVSATPERLNIAKAYMEGKTRDYIFSSPFIRGLYLHFLPDLNSLQRLSPPDSFTYEVLGMDEVCDLAGMTAFDNAVIHDPTCPYQTVLAVLAKHNGSIVGIAGASNSGEKMWQLGIDVLPGYRRNGLAAYLVNRLTFEVLERGCVPTYDVIASNIASQRVGVRAGYVPAYVTDWRCDFTAYEA